MDVCDVSASVITEMPFTPLTPEDLDPNTHSIVHCTLMRLKSEPDERKLCRLLAHARRRIPGLIELHFGKNNTDIYKNRIQTSKGITHALVSRHQNAHSLQECDKHPDFVALRRYLFELLIDQPYIVDFVNIPSRLEKHLKVLSSNI